ncbi:MAG TPA: transglutaminase domain-containing protein, partial [Bryobacteraceae bacterium]|nr:transglutaminase domain-containing protein [Bryobacteraceae bacterium]
SYAVFLSDIATDHLFFAGTPQFMRIDSFVMRRPFGNYSVQFGDGRNVWYQALSLLETPRREPVDLNDVEALPADLRSVYLQLPAIDPRIRELAHSIAGGATSPLVESSLVEHYLRTHYGYTLELPSVEPADPLAFFLFQRKKGHCEYFASAMAVMLRTLDIPSRVITGFQSGIYNPISESLLIRTSDAHSWVEAWLPDRGWTTFDPTPPDPNPPTLSAWGRLGFYADAADVFWQDWVLNYNLDRQLLLASRVGESSRRFGWNWADTPRLSLAAYWRASRTFLQRYGYLLLGVVLLALAGKLFGREGWSWFSARRQTLRVQRGEAVASDATLLYQRMLKNLKRRGVEKPAWLTPCEFARVVQRPELAVLLEDFTSAYNELRFGGNLEAAGRIVVMLERLEALP